jgi:hypothetical protein
VIAASGLVLSQDFVRDKRLDDAMRSRIFNFAPLNQLREARPLPTERGYLAYKGDGPSRLCVPRMLSERLGPRDALSGMTRRWRRPARHHS